MLFRLAAANRVSRTSYRITRRNAFPVISGASLRALSRGRIRESLTCHCTSPWSITADLIDHRACRIQNPFLPRSTANERRNGETFARDTRPLARSPRSIAVLRGFSLTEPASQSTASWMFTSKPSSGDTPPRARPPSLIDAT